MTITPDLAKRIAADFVGQTLDGCRVDRYHNHGASSVVLLGQEGENWVAIKVYGKHLINDAPALQAKTELARIKRQVDLKDSPHPNIVRTKRSGQCNRTGYHFLIMEFIDDKTLEEVLSDIPRERIRNMIRDIAKAALYLQQKLGHVHRDIKPANIAVNLDTYKVTLLDLGLIRPVSGETVTDQAPRFVGTKRYAPPEFLKGTMTKDEKGWDAVSFYQLGAILYSLIMRRLLFEEHKGEDVLRAIELEVPHIDAPDVPPDLIQLARDCLQKSADTRLKLVTWDRFFSVPDPNALSNEMDRLRQVVRSLPVRETPETYPAGAKEQHAIETAYKRLTMAVDYHLRSLLSSDEHLFPQHQVTLERTSQRSFSLRATISYDGSPARITITAFLLCDIVDVASLLCNCRLIGLLGDVPKVPDSSEVLVVFNGSFVEGVFSERLDIALSSTVSRLIESSAPRGTATAAPSSTKDNK